MITDRTAKARQNAAFIIGHNQGVKKTTAEAVSAIAKLIAPFHWCCTKHQECPDFTTLCSRTTDEPCAFRTENPNYKKAMEEIRIILCKQAITR